jgi:hypothetical protein
VKSSETKLMEDGLGKEEDWPKVKVKWKHWAKDPCSSVTRKPMYWRYPVEYAWSIRQDVKDEKGKSAVKEVGSGTFTLFIELPTDKYQDDAPYVQCKCSLVKKTKDDSSFPTDNTASITKQGPPVEVCTTTDLNKFNFEVTCNNMNEAVCSATNYTQEPVDLCIEEGMCFECVDDSAQDVICVHGCVLHLPALPMFASTFGGWPASKVSGTVRLECLNMHKPEPNAKLRYVPRWPDNELAAIAKFQRAQRFGGSWDQTRMWIYTDHAKLDEISKILVPRPSEGAYVMAAYQLSTILPLLDFSRPELKACLEPSLIVGAFAPREATEWFVTQMSTLDPNGLAEFINGNPSDFEPLWTNSTNKLYSEHLGNLASALLLSRNAKVRSAGIRFLLKTVPADRRDIVRANSGLRGAETEMMLTGDAGEAASLLDIAEAYGPAELSTGLLNLSPSLPAGVKARAAKLLEKASNLASRP